MSGEARVKRLLIVEDEPTSRWRSRTILRREGYETVLATDGHEAVRLAIAEPFDLILLDVMLPGKDGFDVCRDVRRAGRSMPIVLLTAKAQEAEKVLGLELGADDYVTKPYSAARAQGTDQGAPAPGRGAAAGLLPVRGRRAR